MNRKMQQLRTISSFAFLLTIPGLVYSAVEDNRWYVTGMGRYIFDTESIHLDDESLGASFGIGKMLTPYLNLEMQIYGNNIDQEGGNDQIQQRGVGLDLMLFPIRSKFISPYVLLGMNHQETEYAGFDARNPTLETGLGFLSPLNDYGVSFRADLRYRYDPQNEPGKGNADFDDWMLNFGLLVPIGQKPTETQVAAEEADDYLWPAETVEAEVLDSDGDGVPDDLDACPGTEPNIMVDAAGCPISMIIELPSIHFAFDSDKLTETGKIKLDEVTAMLEKNPSVTAIVAGHADSTGPAAYNVELSRRRSESTRQYLISQGIDAERMSIMAYGETRPVDTNETKEGRTHNRRVEFEIE